MPAREAILEGRTLRRLHVGPIDFALRPGECVSIGGKSGAGKSVLLRMVADLDPHEGDALLDGAACSDMPAPKWRRKVTYVAAESGWWDERVEAHFSSGTDFAALFHAVGIPAEAWTWPIASVGLDSNDLDTLQTRLAQAQAPLQEIWAKREAELTARDAQA